MLAEPGWCYAVFLAAVGGIALCLPPRESRPAHSRAPSDVERQLPGAAAAAPAATAGAHAAAAGGLTPGRQRAAASREPGPGSLRAAAGSNMQEGASKAGAGTGGDPLSGRTVGEGGPSRGDHAELAASTDAERDPLSGAAAGGAGGGAEPAGAGPWAGEAGGGARGVELGEGTAERGGADARAEAAVADALQRWRMADDDDDRGRTPQGSQAPGAPARGGPGGRLPAADRGAPTQPGSGQEDSLRNDSLRPGGGHLMAETEGRTVASAGGGQQADGPTAVQLFAGFVSYEMLDAVVVGGPGGRTRRDASASGAHWVKMKGPGAHTPPLLTVAASMCRRAQSGRAATLERVFTSRADGGMAHLRDFASASKNLFRGSFSPASLLTLTSMLLRSQHPQSVCL